MNYVVHLVIVIEIYALLAVSLDLLVGRTGLLSIAHAAFFGIGAYVSALASLSFHTEFVINCILAAAAASVASVIVSIPSVRLRGDYFVIATFALQLIASNIFNNWTSATRGPLGLTAIPPLTLLGYPIGTKPEYALTIGVVTLSAYIVITLAANAPFGRVLAAIRADELHAMSLGKNTTRVKVVACAVSAACAGIAGCLYSHYYRYIDPSSFTVNESILIIAMIMAGGAGTSLGAFVGAAMLVLVPEILRFLELPTATAANIRQIIYGLILMAAVALRPHGLKPDGVKRASL